MSSVSTACRSCQGGVHWFIITKDNPIYVCGWSRQCENTVICVSSLALGVQTGACECGCGVSGRR